jgi:hypothetical protein
MALKFGKTDEPIIKTDEPIIVSGHVDTADTEGLVAKIGCYESTMDIDSLGNFSRTVQPLERLLVAIEPPRWTVHIPSDDEPMCGRIIQRSSPLRLAIVDGLDFSDNRMGNVRSAILGPKRDRCKTTCQTVEVSTRCRHRIAAFHGCPLVALSGPSR